ncbi:MAG: PIN domain-containing protein [Gammaproteobacteria bacterium]|nr:PIN domain-containing protein [Gammaproteobacteria bacterium]
MGLSTLPAGSRIYLDANVWIYALEGYAAFTAALTALFARIDAGDLIAVTSELTLAEVRVKPFADGNDTVQQRYLEVLQERPSLHLAPLNREVLIAAARLRAHCPALKMPIGEAPKTPRRGPAPKLQRQIERIQELPKPKQRFVMEMLETVLAQASR